MARRTMDVGMGLVTTILIVGAAIGGANGDAMVSGSVFCDQCKDGQVSLFMDYPLTGQFLQRLKMFLHIVFQLFF